METACLRIKFTPLLQETNKLNPTCCLEIVPEVSHLQNFDKLTWKKETDYIEYTVPITYKIILKKQNTSTNTENKIVKTYYSCVDLLLSSSQSNYDLASGDVSRIISDPFISCKIPTNTTNNKSFISHLIDDFNDVTQIGISTHGTVAAVGDGVEDDGITKSPQQRDTDTVADKFTNTESISTVQTFDTNFEWTTNNKSEPESKHTLSISPMNSVNPGEISQRTSKITEYKAITCHVCTSQKDLVPLKGIYTRSSISDESEPMFSKFDNKSRNNIKSLFITSRNGYTPATRIAQYVQYMETELLPLNIFLDDLITKCSILGVNRCSTKYFRNNMLLYKSVSRCKDNSETFKKSTSNRAVYSIVSND